VKKTALFSTLLLLVISLFSGITGCGAAKSVTLNISSAASMTDALAAVDGLYIKKNSNVQILENFASSGTLQTQIENGAPADVFISAASKQMNSLEEKGLILTDTRKDLLNNKVVLIVPENSTLDIKEFSDLLDDEVKQIALGDPEFVPAGTYGKQALELLGIYEQVEPKLILGSDVRQVLSYVESGNVDAGIVYSTDAAISSRSKVVAIAPDEINAKIVYPIAVIKASTNVEAANEYIDFLFGDGAAAIFEKYGFSMVGR
jgi:molybdate transport system substrate-binding protein